MFSLKKKYLLLNGVCAALSVAAIAWFFSVCNDGFTELVNISAKNLNALYTTGELKSLIWKEMSLLEEGDTAEGLVELEKVAGQVSLLANHLQTSLSKKDQKMIRSFLETHSELHEKITSGSRADIQALYNKAYRKLTEFGDSVLLDSQEQQGVSIQTTRRDMTIALAGASLFTFLILLASVLYFQNHMIHPLIKISSASLKVAEGDYLQIEGIVQKDEIGILVSNFNHMVKEIQESADAIRSERDIAQKANSAKSSFLANMSHELRTPMHGILSYARFGQQKVDTASKEKIKMYFDEIHDSGSRLLTLLNDILDLSKLEAEKIEYSLENRDLADTVMAVIDELKAFAEERKLQLQLIGGEALYGYYDNMRIMQVIRNLLSNAIKFSNPETTIRVELESAVSSIRCRISNYGVGISSSELETVFDKFIQSSKTRTAAGGTGLGLAICKEIIEQHNGKIWAESIPDGETHFVFEIPMAEGTVRKVS